MGKFRSDAYCIFLSGNRTKTVFQTLHVLLAIHYSLRGVPAKPRERRTNGYEDLQENLAFVTKHPNNGNQNSSGGDPDKEVRRLAGPHWGRLEALFGVDCDSRQYGINAGYLK